MNTSLNIMTSNSPVLIVSLNSEKTLEYYRERELNQKQRSDLDKMEAKLDAGITVEDNFIRNPNPNDKAIFIANNLAQALLAENEAMTAFCCSYLATRYPELKHLKICTKDMQLSIEMMFDKEFTQQSPIKFISKSELS